jgi:nucleotide-binding universal stress UspA family protein
VIAAKLILSSNQTVKRDRVSMSSANRSETVIIVGIDGSDASKDALRWAARQAQLTGTALRAVMACHVPTVAYGLTLPRPVLRDVQTAARARLDEVVVEALGVNPPIAVDKVVVEGPAAQELVQASQVAGLVVVGSRGHGAFAGMLVGSVSQHCVAHAACPVVVVRDYRV